jgi:hypothetical protein
VQHPKEAEPTGEPVAIGEDGEIDHDVEVEEVDPTVEGERCNAHKSNKIGASAVGHLLRKKNKEIANPFPGGKQLMKKQLNAAKYCSCTGGTRQGVLLGHCKATNSPDIMQANKTKTKNNPRAEVEPRWRAHPGQRWSQGGVERGAKADHAKVDHRTKVDHLRAEM